MIQPKFRTRALSETSVGPALLGPAEPPAFEVVKPLADRPLLLVCDHASPRIPRTLAGLGLDDGALRQHIAFDIGAATLTRLLAKRLAATAILAQYSRLVIDCNRDPADVRAIVAESDGIPIPGNRTLTAADRAIREAALHRPYHAAIDREMTRLRRLGAEPVLVSVHSFTPSLGGEDRRWDVGVLWNRDPRVAGPLIEILARDPDLVVGDNEPYSGREIAYTINRHGGRAGLANAAIEVRQDHCEDLQDLIAWADRLARALNAVLADEALHRVEHF